MGIIYLTPHGTKYSSEPAEGNAPEAGAPEIEVTPAMIEAGAEVVWQSFSDTEPYGSSFARDVAERVFRVMVVCQPERVEGG